MNRPLRQGQDATPLGLAARRAGLAAQGMADRPEFAAMLDEVEAEARRRLGRD